MSFNIAIDGPAGAGKSTIAKKVAAELGYIYVDTGAMYRAITLHMLRAGIDVSDMAALEAECSRVDISLECLEDGQHVYLAGEDVSSLIRTEEVGMATSTCSACPGVRARMTAIQKSMADSRDLVMDGRDIGTVVLPQAQLKIYLTASVEARAGRRYKELVEKGQEADLTAIADDIEKRDQQDMTRKVAPLRRAQDAIYLDSSDMTVEEVTDTILKLARERMDSL